MNTEYILQMLTFIIIYSFLGWVLESVSKSIEQKELVNSGFLKGPICPIYGFGALIMILGLSFLKDNIILLFIVSFFILSLWEYIVGVFLEKVFKTKYWDYSHLKFNFQGRICLKNSLAWGVLGVLFVRYIHPCIANVVILIPIHDLKYLLIIIYSALTVDVVTSISEVTNLELAISKMNELGDTIKEKVEELKNTKTKVNKENIEKMIRELKITQTKLKIKIYKQTRRMKKAFPSMNSETITKFLSQKVDLESLKKYLKKEK